MIKLCAFSDEASADLFGQIKALQRNKISYTELRSIDAKNVADFTECEAKEYGKILCDNGISVWSIGSPLGKERIDVNFEKYLDKVRHVCTLSNLFGVERIRIFSFFEAYENKEKVFAYLNKMVEVAKEYGVTLCHENEKEIYGDTLERVLEISKNVKGLGFVYDPANYVQVGADMQKVLDAMHVRSTYFHIKDIISTTGELVPAGYGDGKIKELIERIEIDTVLTIEPHLALFDAYKGIDNTEMKHKFKFENNDEAFDAAVVALKRLLKDAGYREIGGDFK